MRGIKLVADAVVDMLFRGAVGLLMLYLLALLCRAFELPVLAGINPATFVLIAVLGIPGFFLVLAIGLVGCF